ALANTTGTLGVTQGGTGVTSFTANSLLYSNAAGTGLAFAATSSLNIGGTSAYQSVATTTHSFSGPFAITGTIGALVGGTNSTVTYTGLATTSQPSSSNILVSNGTNGVYGVATTSFTPSAEFTIGGTLGALVGGANSTLT